ncbi:MAG: hypothetical protein M1118_07420 [Chloroflexi bacterium]|nr:hypothetical protein [Chloroflexota bacterium]
MSADQARRPFEPADITRIAWVGDAQISPDGSVVAYAITHLSVDEDEYLGDKCPQWRSTSVHEGVQAGHVPPLVTGWPLASLSLHSR